MAKYNTIKYNDTANCPGVGISVFFQGCPHHCPGCFNPETWPFDGGKQFTQETIEEICSHLNDNGVHRDLNILGGEPLCYDNIYGTMALCLYCKENFPDVKIYLWTGYTWEQLQERKDWSFLKSGIIDNLYCLIDGPFIEEKKKLNMPLRGSTNQRIIYLKNGTVQKIL